MAEKEENINDVTPVKYLITLLNDEGDFLREYKALSKPDQDDMKKWAVEEQAYNKSVIAETSLAKVRAG